MEIISNNSSQSVNLLVPSTQQQQQQPSSCVDTSLEITTSFTGRTSEQLLDGRADTATQKAIFSADALKKKLATWQAGFEIEFDCKPTKEDIRTRPRICKL